MARELPRVQLKRKPPDQSKLDSRSINVGFCLTNDFQLAAARLRAEQRDGAQSFRREAALERESVALRMHFHDALSGVPSEIPLDRFGRVKRDLQVLGGRRAKDEIGSCAAARRRLPNAVHLSHPSARHAQHYSRLTDHPNHYKASVRLLSLQKIRKITVDRNQNPIDYF